MHMRLLFFYGNDIYATKQRKMHKYANNCYYMNKNTRSLMAYALTISMLFNTATDNQNKRVENS